MKLTNPIAQVSLRKPMPESRSSFAYSRSYMRFAEKLIERLRRARGRGYRPPAARFSGRRRMDERRFYDEKEETKQQVFVCPHCRQETSFPVRWMVRTKKSQIPAGVNEEDKKQFAKASSYMVRVDNLAACRKCRKRYELTGQSVFLI
jgi:hypothetical protein